ncbi:hypothetical protein BJX96DRAFT_150454 [Aspergillus floccosus]
MILPSRQQTRPETDYERWLCDQDSAYIPNAKPQYHPPTADIGRATQNDQRPLSDMNGETYQHEDRPHGRFLVPPNMQPSISKESVTYMLNQPSQTNRRATAAGQLSLTFIAVVVLIKAIKIMKKRVKSRRIMLPVTEGPLVKEETLHDPR